MQRLFWDMYDTNSDSRDTLSNSDLALFNVVRGTGVVTLSAAWALVRASGLVPDNQTDPCRRRDHDGPRRRTASD